MPSTQCISRSAESQRSRGIVQAALAIIGLVISFSGCGSHTTRLSGVVTLDGRPIEKAIVQFSAEQRDAASAVAISGRDGRYTAVVAPVPYRVTIVAQRVAGQRKDDLDPNGRMVDFYEDLLPARYRDPAKTPLRVVPAEAATTIADFSLVSAAE